MRRTIYLAVPAATTCIVHALTGIAWGWAALAAFVGWPIVGTLVTLDDDAPGGWSNLDGKRRPEWRTLLFWIQLVRNGAIAASVWAVDTVFRAHAPVALIPAVAVALLGASTLHLYVSRKTDSTAPKQIYDLELKQFLECPIWVYLSEGEPGARDECTVVPCRPEAFDFETMYVALATFRLACGREYSGFVHPESALGDARPCMFVGEEAITFWSGIVAPAPQFLAKSYDLLNLSASEVFPIQWCTEHAPEPKLRSGIIDGFGYVTDDGDRYVT